MRIATNRCYTRVPKVKYVALEACFLEERNDKAPKATIYVQSNFVFLRQVREAGDIVHAPVREINGRTNNLKNVLELPCLVVESYYRTIMVFLFLKNFTLILKPSRKVRNTHIARFNFFIFTFRVTGSTGIVCTLTFK